MEYVIEQYIAKFSKKYNYYDSKTALKLLVTMSDAEKQVVLADPEVQKTIMNINDTEILRAIFRSSTPSFQEVMFANQTIQDLLIAPNKSIRRKSLIENYNRYTYHFSDGDIRKLETFIHTIKSPLVREQLIQNKVFQRIIMLCQGTQLKKSFFRGIDEVKLFHNIINDEEIYGTKKSRRKNMLTIFNVASPHILLTSDFQELVGNTKRFIEGKRYIAEEYRYPQIFVDKDTLNLFNTEMLEELLEFDNVDKNLIAKYLKDDVITNLKNNNYDFSKIFSHLLTGRYDCFNGLDLLYFNLIVSECPDEVKFKLVDFIFNILCNTEELDESENKLVKDMLMHRVLTNHVTKEDYQCLFTGPSSIKTIFYLKFGRIARNMDYINGISKFQLLNINVKHINQIIKVLKLENEDELSNIYAWAIKLYLVFGLERTLQILKGDYGDIDRTFFDNVSSLDISKVKLVKEGSKYLPKINDEFINFMFASRQNNHFQEMLQDKTILLNKNWSYLYNNFDELKNRCHGVLTLKKLNIIFKQLSPTRDIKDVTPDNYRLKENDILNDVCLGNKSGKSNEEVYKNLLDIYDKMKERREASIPYAKGIASNGYSYEMMKFNDPIIFTLGYKGNCCIRVNDIAHNHLLHAALCRNGRILLIYDQDGNLAAFVPLKRNGEVLIANSIECLHKKRNEEAIIAFEDAIKGIIKATNKDDEINLVCIGSEAYARPEGEEFPKNIKTPTIYEKEDSVYKNTDAYHKILTICYKSPNIDLENIKYGNPLASYVDPRNKVSSCDFYYSTEDEQKHALDVINAVRYANADLDDLENFRKCSRYGFRNCIYNDDWYILLTNNGDACGDYLNFDKRAKEEYDIALMELMNDNKIKKEGDTPLIKRLR